MPLFSPPNIERLKAKRDVQGLIKALQHRDAATRRDAATALGDIGDERAVDPLIASLGDGDADMRYESAEALGKLRDHRAVEGLARLLDWDAESSEYVRAVAAHALGRIGDPRAADHLRGALFWALAHGDGSLRNAAAEGLRDLGDESAKGALLASLESKEGDVRGGAAQALGKLRDSNALEPLVGLLEDEDEWVRLSAVYALKDLGQPDAVGALTKALYDSDEDVRTAASVALESLGGPTEGDVGALVSILREAFQTDDRKTAARLTRTLKQTGANDVEALLVAMSDDNSLVRWTVAELLGEIGGIQAVDALTAALGDRDEGVREAATVALERIKSR